MTTARVVLWGTTIGTVSSEDEGIAVFEYAPEFIPSGVEVCPLIMPLASTPYSFPALRSESFHGLPGMLSDSLPDKFGNTLIDRWLTDHGRRPGSMNAVERLCYTGTRGMGALEFFPETDTGFTSGGALNVDELAGLAEEILSQRKKAHSNIKKASLEELISIGTSAGGARAKAVIAIHEKTGEVRSGQVDAGPGYGYWLIKFDNVASNRDKEDYDDPQYTLIEFAYYQMACEAGIKMAESRILDKGSGKHFLTRRFDRSDEGKKIHMLSLAGMAHFDYNEAGAHSYEEVADIMRRLGCDYGDFRQLFKRMVFNHLAMNYDDHVKNISFLMDRSGRWSLAPAYDVTFAYNPSGAWTSSHQMRISGKITDINDPDLTAAGRYMGITISDMAADREQIRDAISGWKDMAASAGIREERADAIFALISPIL